MNNSGNISKGSFEDSQKIQGNKSVLPTASYTLIKNENLLDILKDIRQGQKELLAEQKEIKSRLEKLEKNQNTILQNQCILSNGQVSLVSNEQIIAGKLQEIEQNMISKAEFMAQTKLLMEVKVSAKKIERSVSRMTGEVSDAEETIEMDELETMLPLKQIAAVEEMEQKLISPDFARILKTYMYKVKGTSEDVGTIIRKMFTDELLQNYNWDGRWGKNSLAKLMLFGDILRDVFQQQGTKEFEKNVKKAVDKSHHRMKQKMYAIKLKKIRIKKAPNKYSKNKNSSPLNLNGNKL